MEQFELPANIKQIGTIGDGPRVYLEDYAYTYLAQYAESGGYNERLAFLIGRRIVIDGSPVLFISAAASGRHCDVKNGLTVFTQKSKDYAQEAVKQYFPGLEVVGWMQSQPGYGSQISAPYLQYHLDNFPGPDQVVFVMDPIEKVNAFYVASPDKLTLEEASGYFIYYDKNRAMHEYMLDNKAVEPRAKTRAEAGSEPDARDAAAGEPKITETRFLGAPKTGRQAASSRKGGMDQRRLLNLAVSLCAVLFIVCFIMGAGLIQNQDRITGMERQIVDLSTAYRNLIVQASQDGAAQAFAPQTSAEPSGDNADLYLEDGASLAASEADANSAEAGGQNQSSQAGEGTEPFSQNSSGSAQDTDSAQSAGQDAQPSPSPQENQSTGIGEALPLYYTIQSGDSLFSISQKFYGTRDMVQRIMDANDIKDADLIYSGKKIVIPAAE